MRACERELGTPAKTGLPGEVKPANYGPFVRFSVAVFDALREAGAQILSSRELAIPGGPLLVVESFPLAAWRALAIPPLPAKRKATCEDIRQRLNVLVTRHSLRAASNLSHDELQALVSGLGGLAIARGRKDGYEVRGVAPRLVAGIWREGFIVNPL
jgi:hypothetical protein